MNNRRKIPTSIVVFFCVIVFVFIVILFDGSLKGIFSASGIVGTIAIFTRIF